MSKRAAHVTSGTNSLQIFLGIFPRYFFQRLYEKGPMPEHAAPQNRVADEDGACLSSFSSSTSLGAGHSTQLACA